VLKHYTLKTHGEDPVGLQVFLTSELGGIWLHAPAALPAGKEPPVPNGYKTGWASDPMFTW
jgi:hypothetical protein